MKLSTSALVVVDVQNGFVTNETRHVVSAVAALIGRWCEIGGRVLFSRYFNYAGSAFESLMDWRQLYVSPDTDLVPEVAAHATDSTIFDKAIYSALTPEFSALAQDIGLTDLVICGIDTDLCVLKTALDAFEHGLTPWVVTDATASTGGTFAHEAGLVVLGRGIGDHQLVTSVELFSRIVSAVPSY